MTLADARKAALDDGLRQSIQNVIEHAEQNGLGNEQILEWVFAAGAEWQKAQPPSAAEVEASAAALVFADTGEPWQPDHMPARIQRRWLSHARAALDAAREAQS